MRWEKIVAVIFCCVIAAEAFHCARDFSRYPFKGTKNLQLQSVEPTSGSNDNDISIALQGNNFPTIMRVFIGATECTNVKVITNEIATATVPAGTPDGTYDIFVLATNGEKSSLPDAFTVIDPKKISIASIDPNSGPQNLTTDITIHGKNFVDPTKINLGTTELSPVTWVDSGNLTSTIPAGLTPGTYDVIVTNPDGSSSTLISGYTVLEASSVTISAIDPTYGFSDQNTDVTISGNGFEPNSIVVISQELTNIQFISAEQLHGTVPAGISPGIYDVIVAVPTGDSAVLKDGFEIKSPATDDDTENDIDDDAVDDDSGG